MILAMTPLAQIPTGSAEFRGQSMPQKSNKIKVAIILEAISYEQGEDGKGDILLF